VAAASASSSSSSVSSSMASPSFPTGGTTTTTCAVIGCGVLGTSLCQQILSSPECQSWKGTKENKNKNKMPSKNALKHKKYVSGQSAFWPVSCLSFL
jgi:hypothetical protein